MKSLISVVLLLFAIGCANTVSYETSKADAPPFEIFRNGEKPSRKYREIGMIGDEGRKAEQPGIEEKMIRKAKRKGAQAIIFLPLEKTGEEINLGSMGLAETYAYKGVMIVYERTP